MTRIEELEKEIKLLKEVLELRKQLEKTSPTATEAGTGDMPKTVNIPDIPSSKVNHDWFNGGMKIGPAINDIVYYGKDSCIRNFNTASK